MLGVAVTNVLPTRELKIDLLRSTNALGKMGVSLLFTLWFFLLGGVLGTLVASPSIGVLGCVLFVLTTGCCMFFIAPIRYLGLMLLHEETKRFMATTPSFCRMKSRSAECAPAGGIAPKRGGTALTVTKSTVFAAVDLQDVQSAGS